MSLLRAIPVTRIEPEKWILGMTEDRRWYFRNPLSSLNAVTYGATPWSAIYRWFYFCPAKFWVG